MDEFLNSCACREDQVCNRCPPAKQKRMDMKFNTQKGFSPAPQKSGPSMRDIKLEDKAFRTELSRILGRKATNAEVKHFREVSARRNDAPR